MQEHLHCDYTTLNWQMAYLPFVLETKLEMFLVSAATVKRWSSSWESIGEDCLLDHRSEHEERDPSLLFGSATLVFELQSWIKNWLKQGGKHKDSYLTIQQLQNHINNVLFNDPDVVSPELLDLHDARYHSRQVSRILRWMHKLGYIKIHSSDQNSHEEIFYDQVPRFPLYT